MHTAIKLVNSDYYLNLIFIMNMVKGSVYVRKVFITTWLCR